MMSRKRVTVLFLLVVLSLPAAASPIDYGGKTKITSKDAPAWVSGTPILRSAQRARPRSQAAARMVQRSPKPAPGRAASPPEQRDFWIIDFEDYFIDPYSFDLNKNKYIMKANLYAETANMYIYVEHGLALDPGAVNLFAQYFEDDIYPNCTATFGPVPDELDGDGKIYGLIGTFVGALGVAGYFDDGNQYTEQESWSMGLGHSNEVEMFYLNQDFLRGGIEDLESALGIIAHEFQHLLQWDRDIDEDLWLNEGFSDYAMILSNHAGVLGQHLEMFVLVPTVGLENWTNTLQDYGASCYFLVYLAERFNGLDTIQYLAHDKLNGATSVDTYLRQFHNTNFHAVFNDWLIANLLCEDSGPYSYGNFPESDQPRYFREGYESFNWPAFFTEKWNFIGSNTPYNTYLESWSGEYYWFRRSPGESGNVFHVNFDLLQTARFNNAIVWLDSGNNRVGNVAEFRLGNGDGAFNIPPTADRFALVLRHSTAHLGMDGATRDYSFRRPSGYGSTVSDIAPPATPSDLQVTRIDGTRIDLAFTAPADDGQTGERATRYDLRWHTSGTVTSGNWSSAFPAPAVPFPHDPGSTEKVVLEDLDPLQDYWFALKAYDEAGNVTGLSNVAYARTELPDATPPARITDLAPESRSNGFVTFAWTAPGDDGDSGRAEGYELRYSKTQIDIGNIRRTYMWLDMPRPVNAGERDHVSIPLDVIDPRDFVVIRAYDEAGNFSPWSNVTRGQYVSGVEHWETQDRSGH